MFLINEDMVEPVERVFRVYGLSGYEEYASVFSGQVLLFVTRPMEPTLGVRLK